MESTRARTKNWPKLKPSTSVCSAAARRPRRWTRSTRNTALIRTGDRPRTEQMIGAWQNRQISAAKNNWSARTDKWSAPYSTNDRPALDRRDYQCCKEDTIGPVENKWSVLDRTNDQCCKEQTIGSSQHKWSVRHRTNDQSRIERVIGSRSRVQAQVRPLPGNQM